MKKTLQKQSSTKDSSVSNGALAVNCLCCNVAFLKVQEFLAHPCANIDLERYDKNDRVA